MKQTFIKRLLFIFLFSFPLFTLGQEIDINANSPKSTSRQEKKAAAKKAVKLRKQEKAEKKGRKEQIAIQSKNTKKMMRKSRKKSKDLNSRN